jgi:hypothetical protein
MKADIRDFIGVFDDVVSKEYCKDVVNYFEYVKNASLTSTRQQDEGVPRLKKDDSTYFFQDEMIKEYQLQNTHILREANFGITDCINAYFAKYDALESVHYGMYSYRLQKTEIGGGYHVWHNEKGNLENQHRLLAVIIYLNDVDEGGETEFLYYPRRVQPKAGRVLLCPGEFTHTHRGNPPISNEKYIITTWISIVK